MKQEKRESTELVKRGEIIQNREKNGKRTLMTRKRKTGKKKGGRTGRNRRAENKGEPLGHLTSRHSREKREGEKKKTIFKEEQKGMPRGEFK